MSHARHLIHAVIGAVSILAIGIVLGVLLDRTVLLHGASVETDLSPQALDERHQTFLRELSADIGLSAEQARQVHEIMSRHQSSISEAWEIVHLRLAAAIDSVTTEIETVLDSAQRVGLHEWLLERHGTSITHPVGEGH